MITPITSETAPSQLPPDMIRVATSRRIEADYEARSVFPTLRRPLDKLGSSTATVHWCSPTMVEAILADARERRAQVTGPVQAAYTTFLKALELAVTKSKEHLVWLSGASPMHRYEDTHCRSVYVTPSQFASIDLPADLKLPGSFGGPTRRATYRDRNGRLCSVARAFDLWPQAYQVTINFTKDEIRERRAKYDAERESKQSTPLYESAEEFLKWKIFEITCAAREIGRSEGKNCHYALDPSMVEAVTKKLLEAEYLLRSAKVIKLGNASAVQQSPARPDAVGRSSVLRLVHSSAGATS